ncbi:ABC-type amino acid transport substrate-binding protein [Paraburkholderia youngii]
MQPDTQVQRRHSMKLSKLLINALAISAFSFTAIAAHAEDLLDSVKRAGVLKIGLEGTYPPFDSRNKDGQLEGFDVDVAKAVAAKLGVKPEFIPTEWSGIIAALQSGKFDVIINQVTITPQRKQVLDFSQPYTYSAAQLIQRADDKREFKSLDEFKGDKKIGVTLGTNYDQMARAVPGINVQTYPGAPEKLRDLAAKRIDATIDDRLMLPYIIKNSQLPLRDGRGAERRRPGNGHPVPQGQSEVRKSTRRCADPNEAGRHAQEDLDALVRYGRDAASRAVNFSLFSRTRAGRQNGRHGYVACCPSGFSRGIARAHRFHCFESRSTRKYAIARIFPFVHHVSIFMLSAYRMCCAAVA